MIMTFDWLIEANKNIKWKKIIEDALLCDKPQVLYHKEMYQLAFDPSEQLVTVYPFSKDSMFNWKIVPKRITYHLVKEVINGNWDAFSKNHIFDIDEE